MTVPLIQTRPIDLVEYIQKESGEEGYIDPSTIYLVVDHPDFDKPQRFRLMSSESSSSSTKEKDRLTNLSLYTVAVSWDFASTPIGWHRVYRVITRGSDTRKQDVLIKSESVSPSGLTIIIDSSEVLEGVIVEYCYE